MALPDRFWAKVDKTEGCWFWTAALNKGYGVFRVGDRTVEVHRLAYKELIGPIPEGMQVDHLCHNLDEDCPGGECKHRSCVNPDHLEATTQRENIMRGKGLAAQNARKTTCPKGHAYDYLNPNGQRECRTCARASRNSRSN